MQETEKYKLKKPDADDFFDIEDFNENTDKIEQALKENAEGVQELKAPSFDDSGIAEGINSFADFIAKVKSKMNIFEFFKNFKAGLKFIVHTGMIVDNYVTEEKGFIPDATLITNLKKQLDEQNKNIATKVTEHKKKFSFPTSSGWYRIAKYDTKHSIGVLGVWGNSTEFIFKSSYGNGGNHSIFGLLNSVYQNSEITILGSKLYGKTITKLRHTVDKANNIAYLEFYYSIDYANGFTFELINPNDNSSYEWVIMDELEKTEESVSNVQVFSIADLTTKDRNVVINSDIINYFKETGMSVTASTDWNDLVDVGSYSVGTVSGANAPKAYAYGMLLVFKSGSIILQIYIPHSNVSTSAEYLPMHRIRYGGIWVKWRNF